ncbi:MAG: ComF family protein [Acidobacteria bacterium]|nr:ComF family protein [Acidobacteriota bacterium]
MAFDRARSFGLYRDTLRAAILLLKFQRRERWGTKLGSLLVPVCESLLGPQEAGAALVVPVPLHPARVRERGYNQADLLSVGLMRTFQKSPSRADLELHRKILKKVRATPPQTGLSLAARHENVRGVFAVRSPELVRNRVILLVDDVMTTGATLSACASVLKRVGAREVLGVTLARATPQFPDLGSDHDLVNIDEFASRRR